MLEFFLLGRNGNCEGEKEKKQQRRKEVAWLGVQMQKIRGNGKIDVEMGALTETHCVHLICPKYQDRLQCV